MIKSLRKRPIALKYTKIEKYEKDTLISALLSN